MIDLALGNLYLLGAALAIGIVTGRWAFSAGRAQAPQPKQGDEEQP